MTGMERFRNVGRREFNNHLLLALARVLRVLETEVWVETVLGAVAKDRRKDETGQRIRLEEEADECFFDRRWLYER